MDEQILIYAAILVAVIVLTIVGILSRYRKCKSDEVLVVYGKTGDKKSAKLYHGGAAFVWPIIQGYSFLNMKPMQIDCKLTGAISKQNIRVDVPTTITVAVSTEPEVMQNAAERLLGLNIEAQQELIKDVVYGQMRLVIADMTIEQLNSDRDTFLENCRKNIDSELKKFGLYLISAMKPIISSIWEKKPKRKPRTKPWLTLKNNRNWVPSRLRNNKKNVPPK